MTSAAGPAAAPDGSAALTVQQAASGATIAGEGIVFTTPTRFTTAPQGALLATQIAHGIVLKATISIMVLVFIIAFIQKRPQGIFALKGRVID